MKSCLHALGSLYEAACACCVNVSVGCEYAENNACGTSLSCMGNVVKHGVEFLISIEEVASAWTNHDTDIYAADG